MRSKESKAKQTKYIKEYQARVYKDIHIKIRKDTDQDLVEYIDNLFNNGESVSALVVSLLREHIRK